MFLCPARSPRTLGATHASLNEATQPGRLVVLHSAGSNPITAIGQHKGIQLYHSSFPSDSELLNLISQGLTAVVPAETAPLDWNTPYPILPLHVFAYASPADIISQSEAPALALSNLQQMSSAVQGTAQKSSLGYIRRSDLQGLLNNLKRMDSGIASQVDAAAPQLLKAFDLDEHAWRYVQPKEQFDLAIPMSQLSEFPQLVKSLQLRGTHMAAVLGKFTKADWQDIYTSIGVLHGRNTKSSGKVVLAKKQLWATPKDGVPYDDTQSSIFEHVICKSASVATSVESGLSSFSVSGSAGYGPVSVSASYSTETSFEKSKEESSSKFIDVMQKIITKGTFYPKGLSLSAEFEKDFSAIIDSPGSALEKALKLSDLFTEYGHLHPKSIEAGGKEVARDEVISNSLKLESSQTEKVTKEVEATASFTASASVGMSSTNESGKQLGLQQKSQNQTYRQKYVGGVVPPKSETSWIKSLNDARKWAPVALTEVCHITKVLPARIQAKINAIMEDPKVLQVFGGIDAIITSQSLADGLNQNVVTITANGKSLGILAQQSPASSLSDVDKECRCFWRDQNNQPEASRWSVMVESDSSSVMLEAEGIAMDAYLTMNEKGKVFICSKLSSSARNQQWKLKRTNVGIQLVNCATFQTLGVAKNEQGVVETTRIAPQVVHSFPQSWQWRYVPNNLSISNGSTWQRANNGRQKSGQVWNAGEWCVTRHNESENYSDIRTATEQFLPLVEAWLQQITDPLQWSALMNTIRTQDITASFLVYEQEKDNDTYKQNYPFNLASFSGNFRSRSAVFAEIKRQYLSKVDDFISYVKEKEGEIQIVRIGNLCVFPPPTSMSPPSGPYAFAAGTTSNGQPTNSASIVVRGGLSSDFPAWGEKLA